jgi:hypothetical protein
MIYWLHERGIFVNEFGGDFAAMNGDLKMLEELIRWGTQLCPRIANYALSAGQMNIVHWLESKGITPNKYMYPNGKDENTILIGLNITEQRGLDIPSSIAEKAATDGYIKVLEWLKERGILPNQLSIDRAAGRGYILMTEWITRETGLIPSSYSSDIANMVGNLEALKWLNAQYGYFPIRHDINLSRVYSNLDLLKWLSDRGFPLKDYVRLYDINEVNFEALEWLKERGIIVAI